MSNSKHFGKFFENTRHHQPPFFGLPFGVSSFMIVALALLTSAAA